MEFLGTLLFFTWFIGTVFGVALLMASGLWMIGIPLFILSLTCGMWTLTRI